MTKYIKFLNLIILSGLYFCVNANCQIAISNENEIAKIKTGTTYIAMKDPEAESVKEYIEVIKSNWTFSKFEIIKYSEIENHFSSENSFLTIGGYETTTQFIKLYDNGIKRNGINYSNTHLYLELWKCHEKYFETTEKGREFKNDDKIQIARIELFTDFATLSEPDNLFQSNYDGNGHIFNWGPGILKNYLQILMSKLNKNEKRWLYSGVFNEKEIKKLKNEILYIPDYVLTKFNKFTGDETKKHKEKDIFKNFQLQYSLISIDELNNKILYDEEMFYYLIYVKSSTEKFITIINSKTGEIIYSKYSPMSYNIKSKDLIRIQELVLE